MSYTQHLEGCYHKNDDKAALHTYLTSNALDTFRNAYQNGHLPALSLVEQKEDIDVYKEAVSQFADFEDILILGTGGSSLGGRTLCSLSSQQRPRLHFLDNIDPQTFSALFQHINLRNTGILVISKSGSTVETLMQLLVCLQRFEENLTQRHFIVITKPTDNPLRAIAQTHNWLCLDHSTHVGGRYSCFSSVSLIPAIFLNLNPFTFRKGGYDVLQEHLTSDAPAALKGAAVSVYLEKNHGTTQKVMLPYAVQLDSFSLWYRQLWAESLGKDGKGTTPIRALGTTDQHSQLQLYLDGPKDKFFTILAPNWIGQGDRITFPLIPEFQGKTMGDLFSAEQKATYETLLRHKCPTRLITLESLDEYTLGSLMMHFMIETILTSYLIGVNAFDQPSVEEGKRLAREYLAL